MSNIIGPKGWNDRYNYVTQTNNPTESFLGKMRIAVPGIKPLQSCGPSTATICSSILIGYDELVPKLRGDYKSQPEEMLMDYFNDPRNEQELLNVRNNFDHKKVRFNEVPQFYPLAVKQVFAMDAEFKWGAKVSDVVSHLRNGYAIQVALKNPGHYIAVVAYDIDSMGFIINDPWPGRFPDRDGFNKVMSKFEFETNVQPYIIVYKGSLI